ncbi:YbaN family protein [Streptococcus merionis]|uniref:YbaN family protein n=1 Tax=Streptococcus merionis TaxID=400065 RepID=UPI0026EA7133|nr:YbaN family protein [Streptococcus merionis]
MHYLKKIIFLIVGLLAFALGTLGLSLPILPTTVFYLIAAFCFARSSDRLYQKMASSKKYQEYIVEPFVERKVSKRKKSHIFLSLTIVFGLGMYFAPPVWVKWMLLGIYLAHIIGLSWYWSKPPKNQSEDTL